MPLRIREDFLNSTIFELLEDYWLLCKNLRKVKMRSIIFGYQTTNVGVWSLQNDGCYRVYLNLNFALKK